MEELDIFAILTLTGLAFNNQRSAASRQELEVRSQEFRSKESAFCLLPTAYRLLPTSWVQGEGYLPSGSTESGH
jgi:hypothetical protein